MDSEILCRLSGLSKPQKQPNTPAQLETAGESFILMEREDPPHKERWGRDGAYKDRGKPPPSAPYESRLFGKLRAPPKKQQFDPSASSLRHRSGQAGQRRLTAPLTEFVINCKA